MAASFARRQTSASDLLSGASTVGVDQRTTPHSNPVPQGLRPRLHRTRLGLTGKAEAS